MNPIRLPLTLCLLAACCSATPALAKQPAAAAPTTTLPDARALVDRHIAASGGKDALAKGNHGTMTGSFSMPAANLSAPMTVWVDGDKRLASKVELPGMGSIQAGIFEDVVWAMDPFQGPRILEGNERAQQIESIHPDATSRSSSFVSKMRTTGTAEYDGKRCYKVEIEWKSGRTSWDCYGVDDGLMLASGGKQNSPMGELDMVSVIKEYRSIEGMKLPAQTEITSMGQKQVLRIDQFELGKPAAASFEPPAAIKALMAQKK